MNSFVRRYEPHSHRRGPFCPPLPAPAARHRPRLAPRRRLRARLHSALVHARSRHSPDLRRPAPGPAAVARCFRSRPGSVSRRRRRRAPRFQSLGSPWIPPSPRTHRRLPAFLSLRRRPHRPSPPPLLQSRIRSPLSSPLPPAAFSSCSAEPPGSGSSPTSPPPPSSPSPFCRSWLAISSKSSPPQPPLPACAVSAAPEFPSQEVRARARQSLRRGFLLPCELASVRRAFSTSHPRSDYLPVK